MQHQPNLKVSLQFHEDASILCIDEYGVIFVEGYSDEDALWYRLEPSGTVITEPAGIWSLPADTALRLPPEDFADLAFYAGAMLRGNREEDHIESLLFPLDIADKFRLAEMLKPPVPAPSLLGIGRSVVRSATPLADDAVLLCRVFTVVYAVNGGTHYDSVVCRWLQRCPTAPNDLLDVRPTSDFGAIQNPLEVVRWHDTLNLLDGGNEQTGCGLWVFGS